MIKGKGKGKGGEKGKGTSEFDYANDWNWWVSADWQGSADWNQQGLNSLAPGDGGSGSSWMRRLCPLTANEPVDSEFLPFDLLLRYRLRRAFLLSRFRLCRPLLFHLIFNRLVIRRVFDFLILIHRPCRQNSVVQMCRSMKMDLPNIFDGHL